MENQVENDKEKVPGVVKETKEVDLSDLSKRIKLFPSFQGSHKISLQNYTFHKGTSTKKAIYWRCDDFKKLQCSANLKTSTDLKTLLKADNVHHHLPRDLEIPDRNKALQRIKYLAATHRELKTGDIILDNFRQFRDLHNRPTRQAMGQAAHRVKRQVFGSEEKPADLNFTYNPEFFADHPELRLIKSTIFKNDGDEITGRVDIWSSDAMMSQLASSKIRMMDGTFFTSSELFDQLYIIHCASKDGEEFVPAVYAFLSGKAQFLYENLIDTCKTYCQTNFPTTYEEPEVFIVDMEKAPQNAIKKAHPKAKIRNCWFHYTQVIKTKILAYDWTEEEEKEMKIAWHQGDLLCCLPLLPIDQIVPAFNALKPKMTHPQMVSLAQHLETYYLGPDAMFKMKNWCFNDSIMNKIKSNQSAGESHNHQLNTLVKYKNCSIYRVLNIIEGFLIESREKVTKSNGYVSNVYRVNPSYNGKNLVYRRILKDGHKDPLELLEALAACARSKSTKRVDDEASNLDEALENMRDDSPPPLKKKRHSNKFQFHDEWRTQNAEDSSSSSPATPIIVPQSIVVRKQGKAKRVTKASQNPRGRKKLKFLYMASKSDDLIESEPLSALQLVKQSTSKSTRTKTSRKSPSDFSSIDLTSPVDFKNQSVRKSSTVTRAMTAAKRRASKFSPKIDMNTPVIIIGSQSPIKLETVTNDKKVSKISPEFDSAHPVKRSVKKVSRVKALQNRLQRQRMQEEKNENDMNVFNACSIGDVSMEEDLIFPTTVTIEVKKEMIDLNEMAKKYEIN